MSDETKKQQSLTKKKLDAIKKLRKDFVICRVAKTTHNLCVMCKELYNWKFTPIVEKKTKRNSLFTSEEDILEKHKTFMREQGLNKFVPKLP